MNYCDKTIVNVKTLLLHLCMLMYMWIMIISSTYVCSKESIRSWILSLSYIDGVVMNPFNTIN